jgi:hypothetical protein
MRLGPGSSEKASNRLGFQYNQQCYINHGRSPFYFKGGGLREPEPAELLPKEILTSITRRVIAIANHAIAKRARCEPSDFSTRHGYAASWLNKLNLSPGLLWSNLFIQF